MVFSRLIRRVLNPSPPTPRRIATELRSLVAKYHLKERIWFRQRRHFIHLWWDVVPLAPGPGMPAPMVPPEFMSELGALAKKYEEAMKNDPCANPLEVHVLEFKPMTRDEAMHLASHTTGQFASQMGFIPISTFDVTTRAG